MHGAIQAVIKVKEDRKSVLWRRISSILDFQTDLPNKSGSLSSIRPKAIAQVKSASTIQGIWCLNNPKKDEVGGSRKLQNRVVPVVVVEFESKAASILQSPNVLVLQENVKIQ